MQLLDAVYLAVDHKLITVEKLEILIVQEERCRKSLKLI